MQMYAAIFRLPDPVEGSLIFAAVNICHLHVRDGRACWNKDML